MSTKNENGKMASLRKCGIYGRLYIVYWIALDCTGKPDEVAGECISTSYMDWHKDIYL